MTRDIVWYIIALIFVVQVISLFVLFGVLNELKALRNPPPADPHKQQMDNLSFKDMMK